MKVSYEDRDLQFKVMELGLGNINRSIGLEQLCTLSRVIIREFSLRVSFPTFHLLGK